MKTTHSTLMNPSYIINLIDRDDGKNKKQGLEKIPTRPCV